MHGLFCKSLEHGIVSVHLDEDWDVLKTRVIKLDYVHEGDWDNALLWDKLQNGYVINDGYYLWCYWDEARRGSFGADLFKGTVVFITECEK